MHGGSDDAYDCGDQFGPFLGRTTMSTRSFFVWDRLTFGFGQGLDFSAPKSAVPSGVLDGDRWDQMG
jgi:hypothetical protein